MTQVFNELRSHGIMVSRNALLAKDRRSLMGLLYVSTFARVLNVPTWVLLHDNIEAVWDGIG